MLIWPAALLLLAFTVPAQDSAQVRIVPQKRYLLLPVRNGAPKHVVTVKAQGAIVDQFEIETAESKADWWAFIDLSSYKDQAVSVESDASQAAWLGALKQSNQAPGGYDETLRPQLHFSSKRGWLNDPNGLLFYKGQYHLFYQHNPYGWGWGNMHWGHAVSKDLIHWRELPAALYPDALGTMFSGSGLVDRHNSTGFGSTTAAGGSSAMSAGKPSSQCLAFSTDNGLTWAKYSANPVIPSMVDGNRDPKVIWHEPSKHWIVALYLSNDNFALFRSTDLKSWEKTCDVKIPGDGECPNFFEIPVDGQPSRTKWVMFGAQGKYVIGEFDGIKFTPEGDPVPLNHGDGYYAAQVFTDLPKGRRVLISWARQDLPGMPFNQKLGIPVDLSLRQTPDGLRLFANPVGEIDSLVKKKAEGPLGVCTPGHPLASTGHSELIDTRLSIQVGEAKQLRITFRGIQIQFDSATELLTCGNSSTRVPLKNGILEIRAIVDRTSVDLFANGGQIYMPVNAIPTPADGQLALSVEGGTAKVISWDIKELKSSWPGRR